LKEIFPPKSIIESYLLYAGAVEVELARSGRFVIAHTNRYPTYEFWWMVKNKAFRTASLAESVFQTMPESMLYKFQENWFEQRDPYYRTALYYILNRCSDVCSVSCGKIDKNSLRPYSFESFKKFQLDNFYVLLDKLDDVCECVENSTAKSDFKLFPVGLYRRSSLESNYTGTKEECFVNHQRLFKMLKSADYRWAILYKYHKKLVKKYKDYNIIMVDKYGNRTLQENSCEDVVVTNF
jgi:hypothetical protein